MWWSFSFLLKRLPWGSKRWTIQTQWYTHNVYRDKDCLEEEEEEEDKNKKRNKEKTSLQQSRLALDTNTAQQSWLTFLVTLPKGYLRGSLWTKWKCKDSDLQRKDEHSALLIPRAEISKLLKHSNRRRPLLYCGYAQYASKTKALSYTVFVKTCSGRAHSSAVMSSPATDVCPLYHRGKGFAYFFKIPGAIYLNTGPLFRGLVTRS